MKKFLQIIIPIFLTALTLCLVSCTTDKEAEGGQASEEKFLLVYTADDGGFIEGEEVQNNALGTQGSEVTAVAEENYTFVKWSDGNTSPKRSDVTENKDKLFTAIFEKTETEPVETEAPAQATEKPEEPFTIPTISVKTNDGESISSNREYKEATVSVDSTIKTYCASGLSCTIKGHGNSTWDYFSDSKPSYRLKLTEKCDFAGLGSGKDYVLLSNHSDATMLRNYISLNLAKKLDNISYVTDNRYVYLNVNGKALGLYLLCEKIKVGKNRIDIEVDETGETADTGFLLEINNRASDEEDTSYFYLGESDYCIEIKSNGNSAVQKAFISEYMANLYNACLGGSQEAVAKYADIDSIVDMFILEEFTKERDQGFASFYMVKEKGAVLKFTSPWDYDLSLGNDNLYRQTDGIVSLLSGGYYNNPNPFFNALLKTDWFKTMVSERLAEVKPLIEEAISEANTMAENLRDANNKENELWDLYGRRLFWEPNNLTQFTSYDEHIEFLNNWMEKRLDYLMEYFG